METNFDSPMEMVTSTEITVMETSVKEPEFTPIARKTRSHDGKEKTCLQKDDPPNPQRLMNTIMKHINTEIKEIREAAEKGKEVVPDNTAIIENETETMSEDEVSGSEKSIEVEEILESYEVVHMRAESRETPDKRLP